MWSFPIKKEKRIDTVNLCESCYAWNKSQSMSHSTVVMEKRQKQLIGSTYIHKAFIVCLSICVAHFFGCNRLSVTVLLFLFLIYTVIQCFYNFIRLATFWSSSLSFSSGLQFLTPFGHLLLVYQLTCSNHIRLAFISRYHLLCPYQYAYVF